MSYSPPHTHHSIARSHSSALRGKSKPSDRYVDARLFLWKAVLSITIAVLLGMQFLSSHLTVIQFTQWTLLFEEEDEFIQHRVELEQHTTHGSSSIGSSSTSRTSRSSQQETFPPAPNDDTFVKESSAAISSNVQSNGNNIITATSSTERPSDWQLFPRWNRTTGIPLAPLLDFIFGLANNQSSTIETQTIRAIFPETLYVFSPEKGVYYSHAIRRRTLPTFVTDRVKPTERIMKLAHSMLKQAKRQKRWLWPRLQRLLRNNHSFPFLAWYGDFQACNYNNWKRPLLKNETVPRYESIPLFTTCARISCQYAFPLPTYKTIQGSMESAAQWNKTMADYAATYPVRWEDKKSQLVWRGSLTGDIQNYTNMRWRLCQHVHRAPPAERQLYDIGLTKIPPRHDKLDLDLAPVGGLVPGLFSMAAFQKYKAILDLDGNSWSSRFGALLCYHSVVLKVDPHFVDYFHFATLIPNVHYIPVHYNLSNLYEQTAYVMHPDNRAHVQQVISNANAWCREHMVFSAIAKDYLRIFDEYVAYLDLADPSWMEQWQTVQDRDIFTNRELFHMVPIK